MYPPPRGGNIGAYAANLREGQLLPLIVIGADERTVAAIHQCPCPEPPPRFYETAESAVYDLNGELGAAVQVGYHMPGLVEFDGGRMAWRANVAYGPKVLGLAATGQPTKLVHTGWTMVLAWDLGDPAKPRRVVNGAPEGQDQSTLVWQAAPMLQANFVIDLAAPASDGVLFPGLAAVLTQMRTRVEP